MTTITQRLREIADTTEQYSDRHSRWVAENLRAIAAELEAPAADDIQARGIQEWADSPACAGLLLVLHRDHLATVSALQADITSEREHASKLRETFLRMQQDQINTAKPLDDPRLQEIFGCAIDGALTIGYQGGAAAPNGHWLKRWWEKGRAVAERENALQERINALEAQLLKHANRLYARIAHGDAEHRAWLRAELDAFFFADSSTMRSENARINALEARQVPASASDEYTVVWPDGGRFVAGNLKSAQDYMSGAILSCAERGVEPPVIVRYVPAEIVPYEPQQGSSKERP